MPASGVATTTKDALQEHPSWSWKGTGWTGGEQAFGDFAPGLVHYTDRVLFDEVWQREELSPRDRSLVTVAALTALGKTDQLTFHLEHARRNGVTEEELKEAILHLAF